MRKVGIVIPWLLFAATMSMLLLKYRTPDPAIGGGEVTSPAAESIQPSPSLQNAGSEFADRVKALEIENENLRAVVSAQEERIDTLNVVLNEAPQEAVRTQASDRVPAPERAENRRAMGEQFAKMQLERRYGPFLAALGLTPEREAEVREALLRILVDASGDAGLADAEYATWMRDELAEILSSKELSEFDDYQAGLPEQSLRQSFSSQVDTMAAGLSAETRAILVDVLVEEALIASQMLPPEDASSGYPLVQRMNIYANTAARFEGVLNETESAAMNRFLNLQHAQLQTTLEEIERAEAAGATTAVDFRDGMIRVEIQQSN